MPDPVDLKPSPNQSLIKFLDEMIEEAKSGDLQSLIAVTQHQGGVVASTWSLGVQPYVRQMVGELEFAKHEVIAREAVRDGHSVLAEIAFRVGME